MRQRFSAEQWRDWFEEYGQSGMSVKEFCRQKGVCQNSFYQWRKKLPGDFAVGKITPTFVPVAIAGAASIEIELPSGAIIRVPNDSVSLRPVLKVLFDIGAGQ